MMQNVRCHRKKRAANFRSSEYRSQNVYQTKSRGMKRAEFAVAADSDDDDYSDDAPRMMQRKIGGKKKRPARRSRPRPAAPSRNATAVQFQNILPPPPVQQQVQFSAPPMQQQMQMPVQQMQQMPVQIQQVQNGGPVPNANNPPSGPPAGP